MEDLGSGRKPDEVEFTTETTHSSAKMIYGMTIFCNGIRSNLLSDHEDGSATKRSVDAYLELVSR